MSKTEMMQFLESLGIQCYSEEVQAGEYNRYFSFRVYDVEYRVEWYVNQSTLYIGDNKRAARIPFKHIYFDQTFPLIGGNKSIGFSYVRNEKVSVFDRTYPFEVLRIPLETGDTSE